MKKIRASRLRGLTILAVTVIIVAGLVFWAGIGTLSAFGYKEIAAVCPLGSLETMLADRTLLPIPLISLAVILVIAILLGRVFCAWICPGAIIRKWFRRRPNGYKAAAARANAATVQAAKVATANSAAGTSPGAARADAVSVLDAAASDPAVTVPVDRAGAADAGDTVAADVAEGTVVETVEATAGEDDEVRRFRPHAARRLSRIKVASRHWVLGGALLSTAIFGFPVFCLVCPIGLTFGTIAAVWRLLDFNEPSWALLVFPAIVILELVVFRSWCRKICPLGALMSLMSSLNIFARPKVDEKTCLRTSMGVDCDACKTACFEEIDLHHADQSQPLSECTKCRDCSDACPVHAISFPFFGRKKAETAHKAEAGHKAEVGPEDEEKACRDSAAS